MPRPRILSEDQERTALIKIAKGVELPILIDSILNERDAELNAKNRKRIRDALNSVNPRTKAFNREKWGELYDKTRLQHLTNVEDQLKLEIAEGIKDLPLLRKRVMNSNRSMADYKSLVSSILEMQKYLDETVELEAAALVASGESQERTDPLPEAEEEKLLRMHSQTPQP